MLAKHLAPNDIEAIVNIIRGWPSEKLTWARICDGAALVIGNKPTRQTLNSHLSVVEAYRAKKRGIKVREPTKAMPSSLAIAAQRIAHQQNVIDELKATNASLYEKFVRWQYNAYKYGLKEHQLNEELPRIDRERTDS